MQGWTIKDWLSAYQNGATPSDLLGELLKEVSAPDAAWISVASAQTLSSQLDRLSSRLKELGGDQRKLPLYGVPFAAKDNIDAVGFETTAGCPSFRYTPERNATVIERLTAAGAILIGKTNLDQFATGLVGVRSPYGIPTNSFNPDFISGGSSSGSASVVARGIVPFSLGTDTAGSGRVPAGLNNIIGLKPTKGAFSNTGVVPACRTLDCVSVFSLEMADAVVVYDVVAGLDIADGLSRSAPAQATQWDVPQQPRFAIPANPEFYGDVQAANAFKWTVEKFRERGAICVEIDFSLFDEVTALLYDGPWVAERYAAIRDFAQSNEQDIHPVVRDVIFHAKNFSAADAFDGLYKLADLKRRADELLEKFDGFLVPTAPTHYRVSELLANPIELNSNQGKYTNFVNLLDWSAVAVPACIREDGLPFGVTLISDAWRERALAKYAAQWHASTGLKRGATTTPLSAAAHEVSPGAANDGEMVRVAVVGAHLRGMPLNHELTSRRAQFVASTRTAANYQLYALANTVPPKPGLVRSKTGAPIAIELWDIPVSQFGSFVAGIPAPLGIGTLEIADGTQVKGFICEPAAIDDATNITEFGGWANYIKNKQAKPADAAN